MKVVILYRPDGEFATLVESFLRDFKNRYSDVRTELINRDQRDGIAMASLYDVVDYPAIMALTVDGRLQHVWQGPQLPLIDEVAAYAGMA